MPGECSPERPMSIIGQAYITSVIAETKCRCCGDFQCMRCTCLREIQQAWPRWYFQVLGTQQ